VDHNHLTGAVRGLLCTGGDKTCNRIIGWLDSAALRRAAEYMVFPPAAVLGKIRGLEQNANAQGISLDQEELDRLAVDWLWMGTEPAP
jgi:hypothetical protein